MEYAFATGLVLSVVIGFTLTTKSRYGAEDIRKREVMLGLFNAALIAEKPPAVAWEAANGLTIGKYPGNILEAQRIIAPWRNDQ